MPCELLSKNTATLTVCARASVLSRIQVIEVLTAIRQYHPYINFALSTFDSPGDKDLQTSLMSPHVPNDFFTKNLDNYIISGKYDIAIHSAKDVPLPLPSSLEMVAFTKSISEVDCLLFNSSLPEPTNPYITIGTSSLRRISTLKKIFPLWKSVSIRGSIQERIALINKKTIDGIIVAKAALMRLNLLHKYTTFDLPPPYAPFQGSLMVIAKKNCPNIKEIFSCINTCHESLFSRIK